MSGPLHAELEPDAWSDVPPDPRALIQSMRAFGYSLPTAIADLVDNSISAHASRVNVDLHWDGAGSSITVTDDGHGMDEAALTTAMRLGSRSPDDERAADDLGRFGLGLKTASFSQARALTVFSRRAGEDLVVRRWDLDQVSESKRWTLLHVPDERAEHAFSRASLEEHGTVVVLTNLDRIAADSGDDGDAQLHFLQQAEAVQRHLEMTFHRFLRPNKLAITVNGRELEGWDPFLSASGLVEPGPRERLRLGGRVVEVMPHILPHYSRLTAAEHAAGGGMRGWTEHQGFYVYRAQRLLVDGGWLGLPFLSEEHFKLARIRVDLDNSMDHEWQLDVRKATARVPRSLGPDMKRIAKATREKAAKAYRYRGRRLAGSRDGQAHTAVWESKVNRGQMSYRVDREHPIIRAALQSAGMSRKDLERVLRIVEETVPVASIVMDTRENPDTAAGSFQGREAELDRILRAGYDALVGEGVTPQLAFELLAAREPFNEHPALLAVLAEEKEIS